MIKGVIFDMDGTMVDSLPYHHEAWKIFFNENKVENFSEKLKNYKGGGTLDLMKAVYGDRYSLKELKKMSDEKEIIFRRIYKGKIKPIKGFKKFLNDLKSRNILIGLASNAIRKNVSLIIKELEIYDDFDSILCELLEVIPITLIPEFLAALIPSIESSKIKHSFLLILNLSMVLLNISGLGFPLSTSSPHIILSKSL